MHIQVILPIEPFSTHIAPGKLAAGLSTEQRRRSVFASMAICLSFAAKGLGAKTKRAWNARRDVLGRGVCSRIDVGCSRCRLGSKWKRTKKRPSEVCVGYGTAIAWESTILVQGISVGCSRKK